MPKSKLIVIPKNEEEKPVDAKVIGEFYGWTPKHIHFLARQGAIPWHGVKFGAKVYRRFYLSEVKAALAHGVTANKSSEGRSLKAG